MAQGNAWDRIRQPRWRRGTSQLFVLTPGAPAPYLRIRQLLRSDQPRLLRHLCALAAPPMVEAELRAHLCAGPAPLRGRIALMRGEIIGVALALDLRPAGLGAVMHVLPDWPEEPLFQLFGTGLRAAVRTAPLGETRQLGLAALLCLLGGQLVPPQRLGMAEEMPAPAQPRASAGVA